MNRGPFGLTRQGKKTPKQLARHIHNEQWLPVVGYEGRYEVSDHGRIWSLLNHLMLEPAPQSKGYLSVCLYDGSIPKAPKSRLVHDLVAAAFIGSKGPGMTVDHKDTNQLNNHKDNLEYVTRVVNCQRAAANRAAKKRKAELERTAA